MKGGYCKKMKTVVAPAYRQHADFVGQIPTLMETGALEMVYNGRNQVACVQHEGLVLMVKRFKRVNAVQQVVYTLFRKTKAERAFLFADELLRRGIDTPRPVAYIETTRLGLFTTGFFVSEQATGTETHLLLRDVQNYPPELAEAVAQQVWLMHSRGVLHGDLNLSNFLCTKDEKGYRFTMIDTNRSHFTEGWPTDGQCLKNLVRLTHRRDLYEDLVRRYARLRGWDADSTARQALLLLERFENKCFRL